MDVHLLRAFETSDVLVAHTLVHRERGLAGFHTSLPGIPDTGIEKRSIHADSLDADAVVKDVTHPIDEGGQPFG